MKLWFVKRWPREITFRLVFTAGSNFRSGLIQDSIRDCVLESAIESHVRWIIDQCWAKITYVSENSKCCSIWVWKCPLSGSNLIPLWRWSGHMLNPLMSYVPNSSHAKLCSFILHTVIFIAQQPLSRIRPESHFLFKHFIGV